MRRRLYPPPISCGGKKAFCALRVLDPALCWRNVYYMSDSSKNSASRRIIGFSLSPQLAAKVKAEATRRDVKLNQLFEELWELYEKASKRPNRD